MNRVSIFICITNAKGLSMNPANTPMTVEMAHRALLVVPDAAGLALVCRSGSLWVTLDHDARDVILNPGERFATAGHHRAIVYALEASTLRLEAPVPATQQPATYWRLQATLSAAAA
jgi:Protein of unknown function (DUF2917)